MEQSKSEYIYEEPTWDGTVVYVDVDKEDCCYYERYINDPLDDTLVNTKVIMKGERLVIIATTDIHEGDEVFISYGARSSHSRPGGSGAGRGWYPRESRVSGTSHGIQTIVERRGGATCPWSTPRHCKVQVGAADGGGEGEVCPR